MIFTSKERERGLEGRGGRGGVIYDVDPEIRGRGGAVSPKIFAVWSN